MLRRAATFGLALLLFACTDRVMIYDARDSGAADLPPDLAAVRDVAGDAPETSDTFCRYKKLEVIPAESPRVVILLDRSLSMQEPFGNTTRQEAARSKLVKAVENYQGRVSFGFAQFPADSSDNAYYDCLHGYCCAGPVEISPALKNLDYMREAIQCSDRRPCAKPSYGSSSNAALLQAKEFFVKSSRSTWPDNTRFALLVTSSEPECQVASGGYTACESAVGAAQELYSMGVGVGVLAVGYEPGPKSCLTQISQSGDLFYTSMTEQALEFALDDLVRRMASPACTVSLEYAPPGETVVSLDKVPIPENEQNGWSFTDYARTSIALNGWPCSKYLLSASTLYVSYCPP